MPSQYSYPSDPIRHVVSIILYPLSILGLWRPMAPELHLLLSPSFVCSAVCFGIRWQDVRTLLGGNSVLGSIMLASAGRNHR